MPIEFQIIGNAGNIVSQCTIDGFGGFPAVGGAMLTCQIGRVPGDVENENGAFFRFPKQHWKNIRTTNVIERLNGEFRRRMKTQGSLPSEDAALVLLFGLIATGQIKLRKIDGYRKLAGVISEQMRRAA